MSFWSATERGKICRIQDLLGRLNCNDGQHSCTITFGASMTWGHINYLFDYKCKKGEIDFHTLEEAIAQLEKLCARIHVPILDPPPPPLECSKSYCNQVFQPFYSEWLGKTSDLCEDCEYDVWRCPECYERPCYCGHMENQ